MILSNRLTEQNGIKNKEKLKQRLIPLKAPPLPTRWSSLCALFGQEWCCRMSAPSHRVSLGLSSPASFLCHSSGEKSGKKTVKFSNVCTEPRSQVSSNRCLWFLFLSDVCVWHSLYIIANIGWANYLCLSGCLGFPEHHQAPAWYQRPPALAGALVIQTTH